MSSKRDNEEAWFAKVNAERRQKIRSELSEKASKSTPSSIAPAVTCSRFIPQFVPAHPLSHTQNPL